MSDDTDAVATMRRDLAEAETHIKALQIKLDALAPHGSCGCGYDAPGQVCQHHSPQLVAALARAEKAEAELSDFHFAMRQQVTGITKTEAYLLQLAHSGEIDPETENAVPWSEVARRHEARATAAEAEVARLTTKIDRMNEHGRCRDKRIRAQRAANRVTWQIVDQRRKWLGSKEARANLIWHHHRTRELEAEVARLAGLLAEAEWKPAEAAPRDGTPMTARIVWTMRWKPYSKRERQRMGGRAGRWQGANSFGGWDNTDFEPDAIRLKEKPDAK